MGLPSVRRCVLRTCNTEDYKCVVAKPLGGFSLQAEIAKHHQTLSLHQHIPSTEEYPELVVADITPSTFCELTEIATFVVIPPSVGIEHKLCSAEVGSGPIECSGGENNSVFVRLRRSLPANGCLASRLLLDSLFIDACTAVRVGGLCVLMLEVAESPNEGEVETLSLEVSDDVFRNLRAACVNSPSSLWDSAYSFDATSFSFPVDQIVPCEDVHGNPESSQSPTFHSRYQLSRVCLCPAVDDFILANLYGEHYADSISLALQACQGQLSGRLLAVGDVVTLSLDAQTACTASTSSDGLGLFETTYGSTVHKVEHWDSISTAEGNDCVSLHLALRVVEATSVAGGSGFGFVSLESGSAPTEVVLVSQARDLHCDLTPLYPPAPMPEIYGGGGGIGVVRSLHTALRSALRTPDIATVETSQERHHVLVVHGVPDNCPCAFAISVLRMFGVPSVIASVGSLDAGELETLLSGFTAASAAVALVLRGAEALSAEYPHLLSYLDGKDNRADWRAAPRVLILVCEAQDAVSPSLAARCTNASGVIECGSPHETDRKQFIAACLARLCVSFCLHQSLLLSRQALAAWTVGLSYADIMSFIADCVAAAAAHSDPAIGACGVVHEELCEDVLQSYMKAHGLSLVSTKLQPVRWSDVGGLEDAKRELRETIQLPVLHPELFASGVRKRRGILFYGPPGCGKTLLAKAVATEMNMNFMSVKGPELINQYVGESERNIRILFQRARDNAPCIVFFDELDALAPARGSKGDAGGAMDRIVSQLLVEVDGVGQTRSDGAESGGVFIIGATNRPDLLDPSLMRPGRFDRLCYLGIPSSRAEQLYAVRALTRKFDLGSDVDLEALLNPLDFTYTGADFFALCSDAMMLSIDDALAGIRAEVDAAGATSGDDAGDNGDQSCAITVSMRHFLQARDQLKPSVSREDLQRYELLRAKYTNPQ